MNSPIREATAGLVSWLADTTEAVVRTGPPDDAEGVEPALTVLALALVAEHACGSTRREPLRFRVRHLVTGPTGGDVTSELLDRALVAAVQAGEPTVTLEPPPPELWLALGARPRVALLIDVAAQVARSTPVVPLVRRPRQLHGGRMRSLHGRVVGPGGVALAGVRVEVTGSGAATSTDSHGRFAIAAVPDEESVLVRLSAGGEHALADVAIASIDDIVIHCDLGEPDSALTTLKEMEPEQ